MTIKIDLRSSQAAACAGFGKFHVGYSASKSSVPTFPIDPKQPMDPGISPPKSGHAGSLRASCERKCLVIACPKSIILKRRTPLTRIAEQRPSIESVTDSPGTIRLYCFEI